MEPIIRLVRDLDTNERCVLEHVVGQPLRDNQEVVIQVVTPGNPSVGEAEEQAASQPGKLPEWCNVFEGLGPEQLADVEAVLLKRSDMTRPLQ
jgi:hypothetical protein